MQYLFLLLFLEGIMTFISPCLLPMLPIYISYFAAGTSDKRKTLFHSIGFVLGFTLVFVTLGAFAGTVGKLLIAHSRFVNIASGIILIILGLNFMGAIRIGFLNRTHQKNTSVKDLNFISSILFGILFSACWTPCVGTFLSGALMTAATKGGTLNGISMLLVYSLGLGIPFVASALLIDRMKDTFDFVKRNYKTINMISGMLLVVVGIVTASGCMGRLLSLLTSFLK